MHEKREEFLILELVLVLFHGILPHLRDCVLGHGGRFVGRGCSINEAMIIADEEIDPRRVTIGAGRRIRLEFVAVFHRVVINLTDDVVLLAEFKHHLA